MLSSYRNECSRELIGTNSSCLSREGWRLHPASGQGGKAATLISSHIVSSDLFSWRKGKYHIRKMRTFRSPVSFRGLDVNRKMTQNGSSFARHWRIHKEITNKTQICMKWSIIGSTSQRVPTFFCSFCSYDKHRSCPSFPVPLRLNTFFPRTEYKHSCSDSSLCHLLNPFLAYFPAHLLWHHSGNHLLPAPPHGAHPAVAERWVAFPEHWWELVEEQTNLQSMGI